MAEPTSDIIDMERFRSLMLYSQDTISIHELGGRYVYASPATKQVIGYDAEELIDRDAYEFFHPGDLEVIQQSHDTILEGTDTYRVRYRILHKDGSWIWVETTSRTMREPETSEPGEIVALTRRVEVKSARVQAVKAPSPLADL